MGKNLAENLGASNSMSMLRSRKNVEEKFKLVRIGNRVALCEYIFEFDDGTCSSIVLKLLDVGEKRRLMKKLLLTLLIILRYLYFKVMVEWLFNTFVRGSRRYVKLRFVLYLILLYAINYAAIQLLHLVFGFSVATASIILACIVLFGLSTILLEDIVDIYSWVIHRSSNSCKAIKYSIDFGDVRHAFALICLDYIPKQLVESVEKVALTLVEVCRSSNVKDFIKCVKSVCHLVE